MFIYEMGPDVICNRNSGICLCVRSMERLILAMWEIVEKVWKLD